MHNAGKYNYTLTMETLFRNKMSRLHTFYCREDFEYSIKQVKRAGQDAARFRMHDLVVMCKARGVDADALLKDKKLLENIPTRAKMQSELLEILHDIYTNVPSPADYMERIVRRLAPEYSEDTVRTAILKKFISGVGLKWKEMKASAKTVINIALGMMTAQERAQYDASSEKEKLEMAAHKLDDSIFARERIEVKLNSLELVQLMVKRLDLLATKYEIINEKGNPCEFAGLTVKEETWAALYEFCESHGLKCDECSSAEKILKIILKAYENGILHAEASTEQMAPFFELLEKDFSAQMAKTLYKNQKGKKEKATGLFKTDKRDARAKKGDDWALLTLCEDFARGRFQNNNGKTRAYLYCFAMVFGMTVVLKEDDEYDPETDMVKNLFEDYYSDNLVRFLDSQYADSRALSFIEREPSGDGINYKNFAEAIYLYYLYRTDFDMTPGERIERAEWMINECIKRAKSNEAKDDILTESIQERTVVYKRMYSGMVDLDEESFIQMLLLNYLILPPTAFAGKPNIMLSSEANTAYDTISDIMEALEAAYSGAWEIGQVLATDDCGEEYKDTLKVHKEDVQEFSGIMLYWKLPALLREKYPDDEGFVRVIDNLEKRLSANVERISERKIDFLAKLLHTLLHHSTEDAPMKLEAVRDILQKSDVSVDGNMINDGVKLLAQVGFDVHRESGESGSLLYLSQRIGEDKQINEILSNMSGKYSLREAVVNPLLGELLRERTAQERKVTRSQLIAVYVSYYVAMLSENEDIRTFPELYSDFALSINPVLERARFQPLSEKNFFDLFVLLSLYFYLVENGK